MTSWLSSNPAEAHTERTLLMWSPIWMAAVVAVVATGVYDDFSADVYGLFGVSIALPCVALPLLTDKESGPIWKRHWFKANLWIAILSFIGNYYLTHYFYDVLGAKYTLVTGNWVLNEVPLVMFFMTHPYFCTYHVAAAVFIRKIQLNAKRVEIYAIVVFLMAYTTAFLETFSIAAYPHYSFPDRDVMYKFGSLFYGLMFIITYPAYANFAANANNWSILHVALHSLASSVAVWGLFEAWKRILGPMAPRGGLYPPLQ